MSTDQQLAELFAEQARQAPPADGLLDGALRKVRRLDLGAVFQDPASYLNPSIIVGRASPSSAIDRCTRDDCSMAQASTPFKAELRTDSARPAPSWCATRSG